MARRMKKVPLSVMIPARNEEENIAGALRSVRWADEVFVLDSNSTDRTAQISEEHGATVVQFNYDGGWPKKKNWGIRNLPFRNEWFLILDADERVTPELKAAIQLAITRTDVNGFYLRWKFVFLGRWMKHSWRHGWMLRLIRRGTGEYEDLGMRGEGGWDVEVHENVIVEGATDVLSPHLLHASLKNLSWWLKKQNEFSDWNAVRRQRQLAEGFPPRSYLFSRDPLLRRKWLKALFLRMPGKPVLMFLYLYIVMQGFRDGRQGLYFCALRAAHELNNCAKVYEATLAQKKRARS